MHSFNFLDMKKKENNREEKDMLKTSKEGGAIHQGQLSVTQYSRICY